MVGAYRSDRIEPACQPTESADLGIVLRLLDSTRSRVRPAELAFPEIQRENGLLLEQQGSVLIAPASQNRANRTP